MKCTKNFNNNGLSQFVQMQQDALQKLIFGFTPILQQNNLLSKQRPKLDTSILEELKNTQIELITKNINNNELSQSAQMQQEALQKLILGFASSPQENNLLLEKTLKIDTSILEAQNRYAKEISNLINNPLFSIMNQQREVSKMIESLRSNLPKIDTSILEGLINTQDLYNNYQGLNARELFEQYFESLNKFAKEMYLNDDVDFSITYDDIEELNKKIQKKKNFTKKDLLKLIRFLEILWLLYSIYSALNPDNLEHIKTQQMINGLDNKISKSLKQELYYEVVKQVNVREFPDAKSKKIAESYPKQKLLIIKNKPYWLQVEYFDTNKNETIIGWVSKKCTKRLD